MLKRKEDQRDEVRVNMRGGAGQVTLRHLLEKEDMSGKCRLCAVFTVEPGCEIGWHTHQPDAEIYYVLKGEMSMNDNGEEVIVRAGDALFTADGAGHSAVNKSNETAELLGVVIE